MAGFEVPILSRLDRLDNVLKLLEDMRGTNRTPRSSCASTPSSGTLSSEAPVLSVNDPFSPECLEKHCRPIDEVIMETEQKGNLIERIIHVEDRLLQLGLQLEEELVGYKNEGECQSGTPTTPDGKKGSKKKNLKQLVKSCVKGKGKTKHKNK